MTADPREGCKITILVGSDAAGNVGYWKTEWEGEAVWETGWFVLPEFQGKGGATQATRLLVAHVSKLGRRYLMAFPSVSNRPSNAICRKLGFDLVGEVSSEYPPKSGLTLRSNVWRLDLPAAAGRPVSKPRVPAG